VHRAIEVGWPAERILDSDAEQRKLGMPSIESASSDHSCVLSGV
jgi:hypothetical protein